MNSSICDSSAVLSRLSIAFQRFRPAIIVWVLPLLLLVSPDFVKADQFGDFTFTSNGTSATITGYTGAGGAVVIPATIDHLPVTSIGNSAFHEKGAITSIAIPSSITSIGPFAFSACGGLTSVTIPESVTSIKDFAFENCGGLTSVSFSAGVAYIGNYAFSRCDNLLGVSIPASVTVILNEAFGRCSSLTTIAVDASNPNYSDLDGVLFNKAQTELIQCPGGRSGTYSIPPGVTSIKMFAFNECSSLTSVNIPPSVTSIGDSAFAITDFTSITIPSSVTSIGDRAFLMCSRLTSVHISAGVTSIGVNAFSTCVRLMSVNIPASVTSIGTKAFYNCAALNAIALDAANPNYSSLDGVLFNKSLTTLIHWPAGKSGTYTVPNGVTRIESYAFFLCTDLTGVNIPASVTSIGSSAFLGSYNLTSAVFTGNDPTMESSVFASAATVYFLTGAAGFTTPTWQGYPCVEIAPHSQLAWRLKNFGVPNNTGNARDHKDPDQDGLKNITEFAFNLNPNNPGTPTLSAAGSSGLPAITRINGIGGMRLHMEFIRRKSSSSPGITYSPQFSSSPSGPWSAAPAPISVTSVDTLWERVAVEDAAGLGEPRRFSRLMVTSP